MVPATGVVPWFKVKVAAVSVKEFIASLKMTEIALLMATLRSALYGKI